MDQKEKLEQLKKRLGLMSGTQWAEKRQEEPAPVKKTTEHPPATPKVSQNYDTARNLTQRLHLMTGTEMVAQQDHEREQQEAGNFEIDRVMEGECIGDEDNGFFLVRRDFPLDYEQGNVVLGDALKSNAGHIALSANDTELTCFDARTALFMDTETTGLAGGSGTIAFLIGVGYFVDDVFRLDQCFMRDYDDEEPMLEFLSDLFRDRETIVGYNSKSFDLPLLQSRCIQNRVPCRLSGLPHYDLVHAARRFWKRRLKDCSLGNIERQILGVHRHGDVPSYLIPQLWFNYVHTRDARALSPVFYHHQMDILSLVSLTAWLCQCLDRPLGNGFDHAEDKLSLVRIYFQQKKYDALIPHAQEFLKESHPTPLRRECLEMLGMAFKRRNRFSEMQQSWETLLEECPHDYTAIIELMKHHEHRTRDLKAAYALGTSYQDHWREQHPHDENSIELRALQHRLERLERKLGPHAAGDDF